MATSAAAARPPDEVVRPFLCPECGSRYTRQEHLSRHQQARHSSIKEFVCATCQKGFARRDILRRHELGHNKNKQPASPAESEPKAPKPPRARKESPAARSRKRSPSQDISIDAPPAKISSRVSVACNRCSKSKLRCDGENPCSRCARGGKECVYDRDDSNSNSGQGAGADDDDEGSVESRSERDSGPSVTPESGEDEIFPARGLASGGDWHHQPSPPPGVSPYAVPLRPPPLHHSLPPSSFHTPSGMASPSHYYPRGAEQFTYRQPQAYGANGVMSLPSPYSMPQAPTAFASQSIAIPPAAPAPSSPFDTAAYGRTSMTNNDAGLGNLDFLDMIANASAGDEIDWTLLNGSYNNTRANESYTPRGGDSGGSGFTPRAERTSSPGAMDLDSHMLNTSLHQPSNLRHSTNQDDPLFPLLSLDDPTMSSSASSGSTGAAAQLAIQDSAAETLLKLASHTPRASPEPEQFLASRSQRGEDPPRPSHLAHTVSDPWPLSYRPTEAAEEYLPQSARGTGYQSRAASPRPGSVLPRSLSFVPNVTATTRARVLDKVRDIGEPERFVPRTELLDLFVQLYFSGYQSMLPLLHRPTFDPNTCPSFLLLAVASVGARYAHDRVLGASMHAQALMETARRMFQVMGDADNTLLRTVAWQQALLIILHTGHVSGSKRDLEKTQAFSSMPTTFARRQGWFKDPKIDEELEKTFSLEERWKRWRDREEIKRLGFGALMFDLMGVCMWDRETSSLYVDAARTSLPCHDALWDAPNATAWQSLFRGQLLPARGLETLTAIRQMSDRSLHSSELLLSTCRDIFAMATVLSTLHALGWSRQHETNVTALFLPGAAQFEQPEEPVKAALEAALEFYQDRVVLPPEMIASGGATDATMTRMLHMTFLTLRLPLRILQPLARTGDARPSAEILDAVKAWSIERDGQIARSTVYHAGQLFALAHLAPAVDTPVEPFALFYAALALSAYIRETAPTVPPPSLDRADYETERFDLTRLVDREDPELVRWIATGDRIATLDKVGDVTDRTAANRVLRAAGAALVALKVWKVGELLGKTLIELANDEDREKWREVVKSET